MEAHLCFRKSNRSVWVWAQLAAVWGNYISKYKNGNKSMQRSKCTKAQLQDFLSPATLVFCELLQNSRLLRALLLSHVGGKNAQQEAPLKSLLKEEMFGAILPLDVIVLACPPKKRAPNKPVYIAANTTCWTASNDEASTRCCSQGALSLCFCSVISRQQNGCWWCDVCSVWAGQGAAALKVKHNRKCTALHPDSNVQEQSRAMLYLCCFAFCFLSFSSFWKYVAFISLLCASLPPWNTLYGTVLKGRLDWVVGWVAA